MCTLTSLKNVFRDAVHVWKRLCRSLQTQNTASFLTLLKCPRAKQWMPPVCNQSNRSLVNQTWCSFPCLCSNVTVKANVQPLLLFTLNKREPPCLIVFSLEDCSQLIIEICLLTGVTPDCRAVTEWWLLDGAFEVGAGGALSVMCQAAQYTWCLLSPTDIHLLPGCKEWVLLNVQLQARCNTKWS